MNKEKRYRILGWIFLCIGLISIFFLLSYQRLSIGRCYSPTFEDRFFSPSFFQRKMANFHHHRYFALNLALLIGLIFHWRADKNKNAKIKSKWGKILLGYFIYSILVFLSYEKIDKIWYKSDRDNDKGKDYFIYESVTRKEVIGLKDNKSNNSNIEK